MLGVKVAFAHCDCAGVGSNPTHGSIAPSSSGRTSHFDCDNLGSNPSGASNNRSLMSVTLPRYSRITATGVDYATCGLHSSERGTARLSVRIRIDLESGGAGVAGFEPLPRSLYTNPPPCYPTYTGFCRVVPPVVGFLLLGL